MVGIRRRMGRTSTENSFHVRLPNKFVGQSPQQIWLDDCSSCSRIRFMFCPDSLPQNLGHDDRLGAWWTSRRSHKNRPRIFDEPEANLSGASNLSASQFADQSSNQSGKSTFDRWISSRKAQTLFGAKFALGPLGRHRYTRSKTFQKLESQPTSR